MCESALCVHYIQSGVKDTCRLIKTTEIRFGLWRSDVLNILLTYACSSVSGKVRYHCCALRSTLNNMCIYIYILFMDAQKIRADV